MKGPRYIVTDPFYLYWQEKFFTFTLKTISYNDMIK